jgi:hypothetical protein
VQEGVAALDGTLMLHRPRFKRRGGTDYKVVTYCVNCKKKLPKNNHHHTLCQACWEERQLARGNLALLGGVK